MTKKEFVKQVFRSVKYKLEEEIDDQEIIDDLEILLGNTLEPRDRSQFANWGNVVHQSTPATCWI